MKGLTHEQSAELRHEIVEYRKQGHYIRECCEHFGVKESYVLAACRGITYPWKYDYETCRQAALKQAEARTADEQTIINAINANTPTLEYVSGYTENDGSVMVRSKVCGHVFETSCISIRHGKTKECPVCKKREAEEKKERATRERLYQKEQRERERKLAKECTQIKFKSCPICGSLFLGRQKYCSERCQLQNKWHMKDGYRYQFPLEEVYEKDSGICYICGKPCDWNDYKMVNGVTVYGNYYPSRDHVVPKSRGGKNEWHNIRLAHRICNSLKADSPLVET